MKTSADIYVEHWQSLKDHDSSRWYTKEEVYQFNPQRFDFRWNEDYTAAQVVPLAWWDDASYACSQWVDLCGLDGDDEKDLTEEERAELDAWEKEEKRKEEEARKAWENDPIPF
jgi:hypothetical protein